MGELMGKSLLDSNRFTNIDYLVPLPLYPDKERKRGYNQAAVICQGMSASMNIPVSLDNVTRQRFTDTQTKKHRIERWENVAGSFNVLHKERLCDKSLLLVDDVVTTGATMEACGHAIAQSGNVKLSMATLAFATK